MALSESDKEALQRIQDKHAVKKEAMKARQEDRKENGPLGKLIVEQNEHGLYSVRQEKGGLIPRALQGLFTTKLALKNAVIAHYGDTSVID